jgi:hypothetical protein
MPELSVKRDRWSVTDYLLITTHFIATNLSLGPETAEVGRLDVSRSKRLC